MLGRLWRDHFPGTTRSAAARLLAVRWAAWAPGEDDELPGTIDEAFARLHRVGMRPIAWRQIADDLDDP